MSQQFVLEFDQFPTALGVADFLVADCNREAAQWLDRWPDWPAPAVTVYGPKGSGKTHLLRGFVERTGAIEIPAVTLTRESLPTLLGAAVAAAVDDAERGDRVALLHLYNVLAERRGHLLLTAGSAPSQWAQAPPDLGSRLMAAPHAALRPPDDALLAALLVKQFADRQLRVGKEIVLYCVRHMERSHASVQRLVAELDRAVFQSKRDITFAMVRDALSVLQGA